MKLPIILACSITALCLPISSASAVSDGILANTPTFTPKITFSDTYSESIETEREDGEISRSAVADPQKIALAITANLTGLEGFEPTAVPEDTQIDISVGNFEFSAELGEDPAYVAGKKQASFPFTTDIETANGAVRTVRVGSVNVAWSDKLLTIKMTCSDVEAAGLADIAASDYAGQAEAGTSEEIVNEEMDVTVVFGEAAGARTAFVNGVTKTTTKTFGSPDSDEYEEFDLSGVNLKASADDDGPVVKAFLPVKPRINQPISITGTATDLSALTLDSAKVNGVALPSSKVSLGAADEHGTSNWALTGFALKKGQNLVEISFSDEYGNVTKVSKKVNVTLK